MNFNKLYEDIFKPASPEEVTSRKEQGKLERFKEWLEDNNINYEDIKDKPDDLYILRIIFNKGFNGLYEVIEENEKLRQLFYNKYINIESSKETFLLYSMINSIEDSIIESIKYGANVNVKSVFGNTPLLIAVQDNDIEMVKFLLDKGADPNIKNNNGNTALIYAFRNNEITNLLRQYGAKE